MKIYLLLVLTLMAAITFAFTAVALDSSLETAERIVSAVFSLACFSAILWIWKTLP